jgi:hypothetical protein
MDANLIVEKYKEMIIVTHICTDYASFLTIICLVIILKIHM